MPVRTDAAALPLLLEVMRAAGDHDLAAVEAACAEIESLIPGGQRPHKSRPDVEASLAAARAGGWVECWSRAHQATCGLTYAFPPDISLCPAKPGDQPHSVTQCTACETTLLRGAGFCHHCGTQIS